MISARIQPKRRAAVPAHARAAESGRPVRRDPAELATTLRDIAARSHRAVRAVDARPARGDVAAPISTPTADALRELADLHPRIVDLQQSIDGSSQGDLISYLRALRLAVESRLA